MQLDPRKITTDIIHLPDAKELVVNVLRLDKIHPVISGNKWFKLKYYINEAIEEGKQKIVTFGGAWSNHIVATAATCKLNGLQSAGIIRGEEPAQYSATLKQAREYGMELHFISREDYRTKNIPVPLRSELNYFINEGGYGVAGTKGAGEILDCTSQEFTHCCCAVGTGTMMAGLIRRLRPGQKIIGISALKNHDELGSAVQSLTEPGQQQWSLHHDYSFGGYAKYDVTLIRFMNSFYDRTGIPLDFVYTGKLFFAVEHLAKNNFFPTKSRLLLIHSGGLQGNQSLPKGTLIY